MNLNFNDIINIFGSIGIITIFSAFFILIGLLFSAKLVNKDTLPSSLFYAMSFFFGMGVFFFAWKFLAKISGYANISLYFTLLVYVIWSIREKNHHLLFNFLTSVFERKKTCVLLLIFFPILYLISRVPPANFDIDAHLGSGSTMLYFNKAIHFYKSNSIPSLTNNVGQTLLASMPLFFGLPNTGLFNFCVWNYVIFLFLALLFYGFLKMLSYSSKESFLGAFFLMFGNTTISIFPICVIDSGAPFILGSSCHALFGVGSFCSLLLVAHLFFKGLIKANITFYILIFFSIASWVITAPENVIIGVPALFVFMLYFLFKKKLQLVSFVKFSFFILCSIFLGITQGGLISPEYFRDTDIERTIPGWQFSPVGQKFKFNHPGLDFSATLAPYIMAFQSPSGSRFHLANRDSEAVIKYEFKGEFISRAFAIVNKPSIKELFGSFMLFETEFWLAFRLFCIPILGLLYMFIKRNESIDLMRNLGHVAPILFIGGFLMAFVPYQDGLKWPFTRFLSPCYAPAQICFFIALMTICKKFDFKNKALFISIFVLTFGQTFGFLTTSFSNIGTYNDFREDILTRSIRMIRTSEFVK